MPARHALLAALLLALGWASPARACSAFTLADSDGIWLAKNFDWHFDGGYLLKNPRGSRRQALPLHGGEPWAWTSTHGSLTFSQYGAGLPYGGINEAGLVIEMLWLDETVYPDEAPHTIGELEWIQYQLDAHASVAEVLATIDGFSIRPLGGKIHYLLADPSGDGAIIEFVDGKASVHRPDRPSLVCTNDTYRLSELAFEALHASPLKGNSSRMRYTRLRRGLEKDAVRPATLGSVARTLDSVREDGRTYRTQWSAIYDLRNRRIHVRPDGMPRAFEIDAAAQDYAPASGTSFLDLFGKHAGQRALAPLSAGDNLALLTRNLPKVGLATQLGEISEHLLDPSASQVRPLDDRATLHIRLNVPAAGAFARIAVFASPAELAAKSSSRVGSVLLTSPLREFSFYNLPFGRYAVGAYHDTNQNGRHEPGEPLVFYRPDPDGTGMDFDDLAFDLDQTRRSIELVVR